MNVFYLDKNPKLAAQYHVDDHFKMILESGQLLSTTIRVMLGKKTQLTAPNGKKKTVYLLPNETYTWKSKIKKGKVIYSFVSDMGLYVQTHINHPSAVWVREKYDNFLWLYQLMIELGKERLFRDDSKAEHKTITTLLKDDVLIKEACKAYGIMPGFTPTSLDITPPALVMPDHCKISKNPVDCYRKCYEVEKQDLHQWTRRGAPYWLNHIF